MLGYIYLFSQPSGKILSLYLSPWISACLLVCLSIYLESKISQIACMYFLFCVLNVNNEDEFLFLFFFKSVFLFPTPSHFFLWLLLNDSSHKSCDGRCRTGLLTRKTVHWSCIVSSRCSQSLLHSADNSPNALKQKGKNWSMFKLWVFSK